MITALILQALFFGYGMDTTVAVVASSRDAAWAALEGPLHSGNLDHRRQALAALATIEPSNARAVKLIEDALQDKDPRVRATAATALGEMKAKQAIPYLKEALSDDGEVAFAAAKALCDLGDAGGRDMLVDVIAGDRKASPGMVENAIRDARKKLRHPQSFVLTGAQETTGALFGPASMGIVAAREAFRYRGASQRAIAASYLAKDPEPYAATLLEWALGDDSFGVRAAAARGLGERGTAASVPKLQSLLGDDRDAVRTMAAASIIRITDRARSAAM
jgi:HEAT repeat protein